MFTKHYSTRPEEVILVPKRGRNMSIGKICISRPLGEVVFAMPYRHRPATNVVSLPPAVLDYALLCGATKWVVRYDLTGECYAFPLEQVEREGWRKTSDGGLELFLPLSKFESIPYQTWNFVEKSVVIQSKRGEVTPKEQAQQLALVL